MQIPLEDRIVNLAYEFITNHLDIPEKELRQFLVPPEKPNSLNRVFEVLVRSAQNADMKKNVVGKSLAGGIASLSRVLFNFDPTRVTKTYSNDADKLLQDILQKLKPSGAIRKEANSIWPQFCKSVLSGAKFVSRFKDADDFHAWADLFDCDERARQALPLLISDQIIGFGQPLACNFLMGLGYTKFGKPDRWVTRILVELQLAESKESRHIQEAIARIASSSHVAPFEVDKLLYLIGSGKFELDNQNRKLPSSAEPFIQFCQDNAENLQVSKRRGRGASSPRGRSSPE